VVVRREVEVFIAQIHAIANNDAVTRLLPLIFVLGFGALAACQQPAASSQATTPDEAEEAPVAVEYFAPEESAYPFSDAVRVGDLLILSGKLGTGPDGLVEGGIGPETRQAMQNIKAVVERHGSSMDRVVKCTVMLADMAEWGAMNEVYRTFFPEGRYPARSAFGASGLALDARVEIECIAAAGSSPS
jgi:reactive intermediate/imine deaminase